MLLSTRESSMSLAKFIRCMSLASSPVSRRSNTVQDSGHEECMSLASFPVSSRSNAVQEQWDALEAAGALNSSQWPSWRTWDKLDRRVKSDRLQCRRGVAVAEEGNPMQTFRCDNVSAFHVDEHLHMLTAQHRWTYTTS